MPVLREMCIAEGAVECLRSETVFLQYNKERIIGVRRINLACAVRVCYFQVAQVFREGIWPPQFKCRTEGIDPWRSWVHFYYFCVRSERDKFSHCELVIINKFCIIFIFMNIKNITNKYKLHSHSHSHNRGWGHLLYINMIWLKFKLIFVWMWLHSGGEANSAKSFSPVVCGFSKYSYRF